MADKAAIGGRGQSLMERQLRLIDELGQGEDDAGRRASLVTVSRLAVRMRRHSQNMLVLAGLELPGRWNQPAMLADVIGAAVAQAGEHERVSVIPRTGGACPSTRRSSRTGSAVAASGRTPPDRSGRLTRPATGSPGSSGAPAGVVRHPGTTARTRPPDPGQCA